MIRRWVDSTEGATFDEFVWRDDRGVHFANRHFNQSGRFFDRHWPVFRQPRRGRDRPRLKFTARYEKQSKQIRRSSDIAAAKRWLCCNPLDVHAMFVEDTIRERKGWRR